MRIDYKAQTSLPALFFAQAERFANRPLFWAKSKGQWHSLSWHKAAKQIHSLARGLRALGLEPGDRVLLVAENRPEWAIADLAIMSAGGITVPAYVTNTAPDHLHILNDASPRIAIVSTRALAEKLIPACWQAARPPILVAIEPPMIRQNSGILIHSWDGVLSMGEEKMDGEADVLPLPANRSDTACLIYTSGTGGTPKGVMTSHGAILQNCAGAYNLLETIGLEDETFLCFLPLSHSYEHTAGLYFPLSLGAQIYYAESVEQLAANMAEVHPTIMTAVPRLYEMMRSRITKGVARSGGLKAKLFHATIALGSKRQAQGGHLGWFDHLCDRVLDRLVRAKVAARFGGRLKALVSGGAPLTVEVGVFFTALGVRILQGYGQTESGPVISCNPPQRVKIETVGPPLADTDLRIAPDGEILVRGELVMQGYWRDPEATRQAIDPEGWLHTGDIGELDGEGYLRITDRKKDIIVNSGGDNIAPQRVEGYLTLNPRIAQAMVHGDRRPHLVALIVPDPDWAQSWAAQTGRGDLSLAALCEDADFRREIAEAVESVNRQLSPIEKVRRFILTGEPFSVDNCQMTPTLKIRRHKIREIYGPSLDALYNREAS